MELRQNRLNGLTGHSNLDATNCEIEKPNDKIFAYKYLSHCKIHLQLYTSEQEISSQLVSELFLALELPRNATSFAISQAVPLHLTFFLCYSVLNTYAKLDKGKSKVSTKFYYSYLRMYSGKL
jgi:hypothetical protein